MDIKELSNNAQIQVVLNIADLKELSLNGRRTIAEMPIAKMSI